MINLKPLIETFKKAIYGRDVRQSIVDLAQAIGDNHNEQEELRNEVKSLNADTKEENRQGKEYITNKKAEMDEAITACKKSIDGKVNIGIQKLETKISQGKQELLDKTESEISSLEQKTTESTQTIEAAISRASKSKAAIDTVISVAGDSKTALYETIQESKSSKTNLDSTIQQSTAKDQELENHITEINKIIADGKAVTKDELKEEIIKLKGISIEVLDTLPESGKSGVIYFIKSTTQDEQNLFDEYAWVNDKWEMIGSKSIDLSQYATLKSVDDLKNSVFTNIGELNNSLADATQKMENKLSTYPTFEEVKPQIITLDYDGFTWYLQIESIKYDSNESFRLTGYCEFDLLEHESKLYKDDNGYDSLQIFKFSNDLNVRERIMLSDFFGGCISFNIVETQQVIALNPRVFLDSSKAIYIQWDRPKDATGDEYLNFIIRTEAYM